MSDGEMISGPYGFEPTWPMPDLGERYGTVHVHEEIEDPPDNPDWPHADKLRDPSLPRYFIASWQARVDGEVISAPYFKFDELDEALSWSRGRASRVRLVIYEGRRGVAYSAGDEAVGDLPTWTGR